MPGNLILGRDYIDFVSTKARIQQNDFVGITSVKGSQAGASQQQQVGDRWPGRMVPSSAPACQNW